MLFAKHGKKLDRIEEVGFRLESDLQHIVEENMNSLLNIDFVKSELRVGNFRIDTVGFDRDSRSFVIIEYKRDKNQSVIDQGMAYMSLLLENKAEFILAYNEKFKKPIRKQDVVWTKSRTIFISRSFTAHQKQASGFQDLPIELYEIKNYRNNTIMFNSIVTKSTKSINTISRKKQKNSIKKVKTYTEDEHLKQASAKIRELYKETKKILESLDDDVQIVPKKMSIMFRVKRGFAWIIVRKKSIALTLKIKPSLLDDPKRIVEDISNIGHWGGGDARIKFSNVSELLYIRRLVEEAYSKMK